MSLPRSFLLISSNLNSTWCLYLNEENVSQAFHNAEMESTILLQQQTSSNVDTWSKIKSINILLLQGTFTTVSCRVRLCKFQVIKRPGREEFCRCGGGIPSKVPRQNPISTIRHIFSSELSREIRTIDALLSPPAALSFSPDSNRTQKLNAVCVRCKRPPEIKSWKNDSAAVRLYDGRANESGKMGSAAAAVAAAAAAASAGRRITQLFIKTRLRKGGRDRGREGGREQPKFPSPSLPPSSVSQRVLQLVSHDDVDRLVQGSTA